VQLWLYNNLLERQHDFAQEQRKLCLATVGKVMVAVAQKVPETDRLRSQRLLEVSARFSAEGKFVLSRRLAEGDRAAILLEEAAETPPEAQLALAVKILASDPARAEKLLKVAAERLPEARQELVKMLPKWGPSPEFRGLKVLHVAAAGTIDIGFLERLKYPNQLSLQVTQVDVSVFKWTVTDEVLKKFDVLVFGGCDAFSRQGLAVVDEPLRRFSDSVEGKKSLLVYLGGGLEGSPAGKVRDVELCITPEWEDLSRKPFTIPQRFSVSPTIGQNALPNGQICARGIDEGAPYLVVAGRTAFIAFAGVSTALSEAEMQLFANILWLDRTQTCAQRG
jgi:hypothetical protein